jgi:hypothetical protein
MGHMFDQRHLALVTPRVIAHLQTALRAAIAAAHTAQPIPPTESS